MELTKARLLAQSHLVKTGLAAQGWTFKWDNAVKRFGLCKHSTKTITVSKHLTQLNPESEFEQVMLHELAHALVGPGHGHDWVWKQKARALGYIGQRTHTAQTPDLRYKGKCPAGHESTRQKRPTREVSCGKCSRSFNRAHLITWMDTFTRTPVHIAPVQVRPQARYRIGI